MEAYREPAMAKPVFETNFPEATLIKRGKVRDIYDAGENLVIVSTDRLSAFDVVFDDPIPWKGIVLNQTSKFWSNKTRHMIDNHLVSTAVSMLPEEFQKHRAELQGRVSLVRKMEPVKLECVVRGYITGSGWSSYEKTGEVCGIRLRDGLRRSERLDEPVFTPTTKEDNGHDRPVDEREAAEIVGGKKLFEKLKSYSLSLYGYGAEYALARGIIIADTKFEFGILGGKLHLIDEVLTSDSSRFWDAKEYQRAFELGTDPASFDKQPFRDYSEQPSLGWNKKYPAPRLPQQVISEGSQRYLEGYRRIAERELYYLVEARQQAAAANDPLVATRRGCNIREDLNMQGQM